MMRISILIFMAIFFLSKYSFADEYFNNDNFNVFDSALIHYSHHEYSRAFILIFKEINKNKDSQKTRFLYANMLFNKGFGGKALDEIENILSIDKYNDDAIVFRCIIKEAIGEKKNEYIKCYADAASIIKNKYSNSLKENALYVRVLQLAESPGFVKAKEEYIRACNVDIRDIEIDNFDHFDRSIYKTEYQKAKKTSLFNIKWTALLMPISFFWVFSDGILSALVCILMMPTAYLGFFMSYKGKNPFIVAIVMTLVFGTCVAWWTLWSVEDFPGKIDQVKSCYTNFLLPHFIAAAVGWLARVWVHHHRERKRVI